MPQASAKLQTCYRQKCPIRSADIHVYKRYKRCLCYDGELLAESVTDVLRDGLGLKLGDKKDEHLEDRTILDDKGNEIILIEIKGSNENVKTLTFIKLTRTEGAEKKPLIFLPFSS